LLRRLLIFSVVAHHINTEIDVLRFAIHHSRCYRATNWLASGSLDVLIHMDFGRV
jgi:hypothetical protein